MANPRTQQVDNVKTAHDRAETNKGVADAAGGVPALALAVIDNSDILQQQGLAIARLEALVLAQSRQLDGGVGL